MRQPAAIPGGRVAASGGVPGPRWRGHATGASLLQPADRLHRGGSAHLGRRPSGRADLLLDETRRDEVARVALRSVVSALWVDSTFHVPRSTFGDLVPDAGKVARRRTHRGVRSVDGRIAQGRPRALARRRMLPPASCCPGRSDGAVTMQTVRERQRAADGPTRVDPAGLQLPRRRPPWRQHRASGLHAPRPRVAAGGPVTVWGRQESPC